MNAKQHLLPTRGGYSAECGASFVEMTPEINDVTCDKCRQKHDQYCAQAEVEAQ